MPPRPCRFLTVCYFIMRSPRLVCCAVGLLMYLLAPIRSAQADVIYATSGIMDGKAVSAEATFSLDGDILQIALCNTGTASDYTSDQMLTDIAFNTTTDTVFDPASALSTVVMDSHSKMVADTTAMRDISPEWGLAHHVTTTLADGSGSVTSDYEITATAIGDADNNRFAPGSLGGAEGLGGADFGLIDFSSLYNASIVDTDFYRGLNGIVIRILMTDNPITDLSQISNVSFSYGAGDQHESLQPLSPTAARTAISAPTPAALPAGLGLMLMLASHRRRRPCRAA